MTPPVGQDDAPCSQVSLRLPSVLVRFVDEQAHLRFQTRSQFITQLLADRFYQANTDA